MRPIKGLKRRTKATDKKLVDQNLLPSSSTIVPSLGSQPQPLDWWDEFSKRISCITTRFFSTVLNVLRRLTLLFWS
ncbi:hypothetical protein V6N13_121844 [Hibiscus sabdariffa]|uniref:Uncharacterized protein n=1 Tax=Hibiscus sabdariffa TaxID=183260 RepID=A0ABR2C656_9ROSI